MRAHDPKANSPKRTEVRRGPSPRSPRLSGSLGQYLVPNEPAREAPFLRPVAQGALTEVRSSTVLSSSRSLLQIGFALGLQVMVL